MQYIIVKTSRRESNRTYTGPTWETAKLTPPTLKAGMERHDLYLYDNKDYALFDATVLSEVNPVGFVVEEYSLKPGFREGDFVERKHGKLRGETCEVLEVHQHMCLPYIGFSYRLRIIGQGGKPKMITKLIREHNLKKLSTPLDKG